MLVHSGIKVARIGKESAWSDLERGWGPDWKIEFSYNFTCKITNMFLGTILRQTKISFRTQFWKFSESAHVQLVKLKKWPFIFTTYRTVWMADVIPCFLMKLNLRIHTHRLHLKYYIKHHLIMKSCNHYLPCTGVWINFTS